jgi:hypothetical protein
MIDLCHERRPVEVRAVDLCSLLGVPREALSDLAKRGIIVKGEKRGSYLLQPSVIRYCQHLRSQMASPNDGDVAVKQEVEQSQLRSEMIPVANVERRWTTKLWNFRSSTLGISRRDIRSFQIYLKNDRWFYCLPQVIEKAVCVRVSVLPRM